MNQTGIGAIIKRKEDRRHITGEGNAIADKRNNIIYLNELANIDYEVFPAAIKTANAVMPDAPQVHEGVPSNLCFCWELGDPAATEMAFTMAAHVTTIHIANNRLVAKANEPRAAIGAYEPK